MYVCVRVDMRVGVYLCVCVNSVELVCLLVCVCVVCSWTLCVHGAGYTLGEGKHPGRGI